MTPLPTLPRRLLVVGLLALLATLVAPRPTAGASQAATPPAEDPEVAATLDADGSVRVLVTLDGSAATSSDGVDASGRPTRAADVEQRKDAVVDRLPEQATAGSRTYDSLPIVAATVDAEGLEALRADPGVSSINLDRPHRLALTQSVPRVGAPAAWAMGADGAGQAVAILDAGVDTDHPFLTGKVVDGACFTSEVSGVSEPVCPGPDPTEAFGPAAGEACTYASDTDDCDHGTHVAGIATGAGPAFDGVAPGASIISIQIFSKGNTSAACYPTAAPCALAWDSDVLAGLEHVATLTGTYDIAAANLSLGGWPASVPCADAPHAPAVTLLRALAVATVVAAGNNGIKSALTVPACVPGVLSVGATSDVADTVPSFSNSAPFLSLLAPGQSITSSITGGGFATFTGTSMATPHVSGAVAVLRQLHPDWTVDDVAAVLRDTGLPVTDPANGRVTPRLRVGTAALPPTFHPVAPARLLDTRVPLGVGVVAPVAGGTSIDVRVTGRGGVPSAGVSAVVLNVTAVQATADTHLTVHPTGSDRPFASNLNLAATQTRPNLVVAQVGGGGRVTLFNNSGAVHLVADVAGWFDEGAATATGTRFVPVAPTRLLDTREGPGTTLGAGGVLVLDADDACAQPAGTVQAVVLNVTGVAASADTHLTVWPTGATRPNASNLNPGRGQTAPNLVVTPVGPGGSVSLYNNSGEVHLLADLAGCFAPGTGPSGRLVGTVPARILDTRIGLGAPARPMGPGTRIDLQVTGRGGVPSSGVAAVALNVTVTEPSETSHLTVWPAGGPLPTVSNLNMVTGQTVANLVLVPVDGSGRVSLVNNSGDTHAIADVAGWVSA